MSSPLVECRYRTPSKLGAGKYDCASPCLVIMGTHVTAEVCSRCKLPDTSECYPSRETSWYRDAPHPETRLGDMVESALTSIGVTKERVSRWLGKPCGCAERKEKLNNLHQWAKDWLGGNKTVAPFGPEDFRKNLMMFVYPVTGNGGWQENARIVREHRDLFDGKRVICIAKNARGTRHRLDSPEMVREEFGDGFDFIEIDNNHSLREVAGFIPLMEAVESTDQDEATFFCHSKGCTHNTDDGTTPNLWRDAMYETLLDWGRVRPILQEKPIVGSFKRYASLGSSPWHYSGTFYWFRNKDAFSRNWRDIDQIWFGAESWPGKIFKSREAACIFGDNVGDLYSRDYWRDHVTPRLEEWRTLQQS